jgi:hypothetical protein
VGDTFIVYVKQIVVDEHGARVVIEYQYCNGNESNVYNVHAKIVADEYEQKKSLKNLLCMCKNCRL